MNPAQPWALLAAGAIFNPRSSQWTPSFFFFFNTRCFLFFSSFFLSSFFLGRHLSALPPPHSRFQLVGAISTLRGASSSGRGGFRRLVPSVSGLQSRGCPRPPGFVDQGGLAFLGPRGLQQLQRQFLAGYRPRALHRPRTVTQPSLSVREAHLLSLEP